MLRASLHHRDPPGESAARGLVSRPGSRRTAQIKYARFCDQIHKTCSVQLFYKEMVTYLGNVCDIFVQKCSQGSKEIFLQPLWANTESLDDVFDTNPQVTLQYYLQSPTEKGKHDVRRSIGKEMEETSELIRRVAATNLSFVGLLTCCRATVL